MRFVFYTHSLTSDWNHGNAHFLRGVMRELVARGHAATALAPFDAWSRANLVADQGFRALDRFAHDFPELDEQLYESGFDHAAALEGADVVVVHEWTDPALVAEVGRLRREGTPFTLLFHDTHHRAVSAEDAIAGLDLSGYDGVLAFGETLAARYRAAGERISPALREWIVRGMSIGADHYLTAMDRLQRMRMSFSSVIGDFDAAIAPVTAGEAPKDLSNTGNPKFLLLWTSIGVPAISVPAFKGPADMPIGVQVLGRRGAQRLQIRAAAWLGEELGAEVAV